MAAEKLTKKQKKALAFRERKGKGKAKATELDEENAVPIVEDQDIPGVDEAADKESSQAGVEKSAEVVERSASGTGKKRKREKGEEGSKQTVVESSEKAGKRKKEQKDVDGPSDAATDGQESTEPPKKKAKKEGTEGKRRYILFVGNLKYTTTREAVQQHFASCDPPPTVRLMAPKPSATPKPTVKSKGFAFLEFENKAGLQQALKLHQSELDGRKINVELTAGGGGKSESRVAKLKERNKELHEQRKKRLAKQKGSKAGSEAVDIDRPQRHSTTSGVAPVPATKRTWSVPESADDKPKKKRGSKNKKPVRSLGTGVNAIPVG
ncbi:hypothetical protein K474DRAFT_1590038 [Panus rudis PR-1116 ss-1]|nr:hypothetical protein K474DRAFT_1590038 [Panus rudis PR-1116 ss-1]